MHPPPSAGETAAPFGHCPACHRRLHVVSLRRLPDRCVRYLECPEPTCGARARSEERLLPPQQPKNRSRARIRAIKALAALSVATGSELALAPVLPSRGQLS